MSRKIILSLMVSAAALAPAGLTAQPVDGSELVTARVSFADLNLSSPAGRASLDRRIEHAIDGICGQLPAANLDAAATVSKCRAVAEASVSTQRQLAVAAAQQRSAIQIAARDR